MSFTNDTLNIEDATDGAPEPSDEDTGMPPPEFFENAAKNCRCCPDCEVEPPCDGCCAGGVCDHFRCTCNDDDLIDDDASDPLGDEP